MVRKYLGMDEATIPEYFFLMSLLCRLCVYL